MLQKVESKAAIALPKTHTEESELNKLAATGGWAIALKRRTSLSREHTFLKLCEQKLFEVMGASSLQMECIAIN